jgi:diketogulonate reductase-like aldo/keto reductase
LARAPGRSKKATAPPQSPPCAALEIAGEGVLVYDQVLYHLKERAIEHAVLPWCEQHGLAVTAYNPFGHGDFPGPDASGGRLLAETARAHDASPRQVALAFLTWRPSVFAIPKASSVEHMAPDEIEQIDAAFPRGPRPRELPMI